MQLNWSFYSIFIGALILVPSLSHAGKQTSMWDGFSDQLKATLPLVLATSTSQVVVQAVLPPIAQLFNAVGMICSFVVQVSQKGFNRFCNRPNPLQASELYIWEQVVDNMTNTLCEQSIAGTIMLKNVTRIDMHTKEGAAARDRWDYYVGFMEQVFEHIARYLESKIPYYVATRGQRLVFVSVANSVSLEDRAGIVFMMKMIVNNLRHLVAVCKAVESLDDLDVEHVKKVARNTLLLIRKLREMVGGSYEQKNLITPSPINSAMPVPLGK